MFLFVFSASVAPKKVSKYFLRLIFCKYFHYINPADKLQLLSFQVSHNCVKPVNGTFEISLFVVE